MEEKKLNFCMSSWTFNTIESPINGDSVEQNENYKRYQDLKRRMNNNVKLTPKK